MKKISALFIFIIITLPIHSINKEWNPGYIITIQGDTIHGMLAYRDGYGDWKECIFKKENSENYTVFAPDQIKAYVYNKGLYYESIRLKTKEEETDSLYFAECLIKGDICLYHLKIPLKDFDSYYAVYSNDGKRVRFHSSDGKDQSYNEKIRIRKYLNAIFNYQPELKNDIEKTNCSRSSIIAIFKKYNNINNTKAVSYQEPEQKNKLYITPYIGAQFNWTKYLYDKDNKDAFTSNISPLIGADLYFTISKITDRILFKVGLNASKISIHKENKPSLLADFKAFQIANEIGAESRFMSNKIHPLIEIGLAQFLMLETKNNIETEEYDPLLSKTVKTTKKINTNMYHLGFYIATGASIPLKKGKEIPIKLTYSRYFYFPFDTSVLNDNIFLSVGYTFNL